MCIMRFAWCCASPMRDFAPRLHTACDQANRPTLVASILLFRGLEVFSALPCRLCTLHFARWVFRDRKFPAVGAHFARPNSALTAQDRAASAANFAAQRRHLPLQELGSAPKPLMHGGGTPQGPPQRRHRSLGRLGAQRITIRQRECSLYPYPTLGRRNTAFKHINNPHVQGARTQDKTT